MITNLQQGKVVEWSNNEGRRIIWLIASDNRTGIVIHSDGIAHIGDLTDLKDSKDIDLKPFIGCVNIDSKSN